MSYLVLTLGDFVLGDIIIGDFVLWDFVQKCFCPRGLCPKGFCHGGFGPKPLTKPMSKIITRTCGKCNKVSTDCFFRKMILDHTIYITDAQVEAKKASS